MYYVYIVVAGGSVVYIGKGTGLRFMHVNSGTSHLLEANRAFFSGTSLYVRKLKNFNTEVEALEYEMLMIRTLKPAWNGTGTTNPLKSGDLTARSERSYSEFAGVGKSNSSKNPWRAFVRVSGNKVHIGNYKTEMEAAESRDEYVIQNNLAQPLNFTKE